MMAASAILGNNWITPFLVVLPDCYRGSSFDLPPANAFRTSDCEIPNCRAIRDGEMPALSFVEASPFHARYVIL
jgi:hypothetical protein